MVEQKKQRRKPCRAWISTGTSGPSFSESAVENSMGLDHARRLPATNSSATLQGCSLRDV